MHLPMCADFYPHGEVTKQFGILREGPPVPGICERAVFVVDKTGTITHAEVVPEMTAHPNYDAALGALKSAAG